MDVAGFDVGDQASCVAVARKRGIDVLLNKESSRETPSVLSFGRKNRLMGTDAVGSVAVNPTNAVTQIKRLLGKKFSSPSVQRDIENFLFEVVQGPNDRSQVERVCSVLIKVDYLDEKVAFTPEQLMAMLLVDLKAITEANGSPVTDCVIAVPAYFTISERKAMLAAAQIANLKCLRLMSDIAATALAYGIYKTDLPEKDPVNVVFVDVGYSALQVAVVAFKKGQLKILSLAWDRDIGGRDFDEVLFNHFLEEFKEKYKIDVRSNKKASFRLRLALEKLKKVLSSIPQSVLNVECLMNDVDVSSSMTRELFEEKSASILERVKLPLQKALDNSGVSKDSIVSVEIVGSSSRVPALLQLMREVFGQEPSRTLNSKECVSRGCALNAAMLSPKFRVRDFEVEDIYPYGIEGHWHKDGEATVATLFKPLEPYPSRKSVTFYRNEPFKLTAAYTGESAVPEGEDRLIGSWTVEPKLVKAEEPPKVKVQLSLDLYGLLSLEANQVQEEEYEEVVVKPKVEAAPAAAEKEDEPMKGEEAADGSAAEAPMETEEPAPQETKEVTEKTRKKRITKSPLVTREQAAGFSKDQIQELTSREIKMALDDRKQEETSNSKNALEAYIYALRGRLADELAEFATDQEASHLREHLETSEDWLYDEGEDTEREVYVAKLEELQKLASPVDWRHLEHKLRPAAAAQLEATAQQYLLQATSSDPKLAHISQEDKDKVAEEATKAVSWLKDRLQSQAALRKTDDPLVTGGDIAKKQDVLIRFAQPIMSKPAPAPPKKKEAAKEETAKEDEEMKDAKADGPEEEGPPLNGAASGDSTAADVNASEPMQS